MARKESFKSQLDSNTYLPDTNQSAIPRNSLVNKKCFTLRGQMF